MYADGVSGTSRIDRKLDQRSSGIHNSYCWLSNAYSIAQTVFSHFRILRGSDILGGDLDIKHLLASALSKQNSTSNYIVKTHLQGGAYLCVLRSHLPDPGEPVVAAWA